MSTHHSFPESEVRRLLQAAFEVRKNSYAPYSNYPVGAAVLTENGDIFTGCNVENVSYPAGLCAERNAIGSAIAAGQRKMQAIAIIGSTETYTMPCGICRQVMAEFHIPYVICGKSQNNYQIYGIKDLLPYRFDSLE